ncbi:patatin-like phospholipase family protein [Salinigranum rubrum]|nr:patatin-like phospholipase family protein [Salinigranum rubrum]
MNTNPQKLSPDDVHYLSFEGGGGKGAAYLGALTALAHPDIGLLQHEAATDDYHLRRWTDADEFGIRGVAGASVGAITAALLASGWGVRALYENVVSDRTALAGFFDAAEPTHRKVPVALDAGRESPPRRGESSQPANCLVENRGEFVRRLGTRSAGAAVDAPLGKLVGRLTPNPAVRQFFTDPMRHLQNLWVDYGLFSGCSGRSFLETSVRNGRFVDRGDDPRAARSEGGEQDVTFSEHRRRSGIDLVLTGTNLRTGRAAYLSARHGLGGMTVADGVRISMGLPFVFKPVRISQEADPRYAGLWVDGGVLNNNPIHAFDHADGAFNEAVLGLRLEVDGNNEITSLVSYVKALGKTYLDASETREIRTEREGRQTVSLPIPDGTLGLFEFAPSEESVRTAGVASANAVFDYFEVDGDPESSLEAVVGLRAS